MRKKGIEDRIIKKENDNVKPYGRIKHIAPTFIKSQDEICFGSFFHEDRELSALKI